ncbi:hypothetical protein [Streptomyces sp. BE147]|nr:hypothetical protein [Streptomyces sp. BE147]MEE1735273.1 hypothetical protein [Streptomyces sp. BE147]
MHMKQFLAYATAGVTLIALATLICLPSMSAPKAAIPAAAVI